MKIFPVILMAFFATSRFVAAADAKKPPTREEVQHAIERGLAFLQSQQKEDGSWSAVDPNHPGLTALPLMAFQREPSGKYLKEQPAFMQKGYAFLRSKAQPDGGIYSMGLANYNTSLAMMALLNSGNPKDEPLIETAHNFIIGMQAKGMANPSLDGGIGYGPNGTEHAHPDLDNTLIALEALRAYKDKHPSVETEKGKDLDWNAAIAFITRCQNLPSANKEPWASGDPANKGGFIYFPGETRAGETKLPNGKVALRSYGTMSYAGLLSFIYADLKKDDPRVASALEWLKENYTLDENPGLQHAGLYYYYHLMSKGLAAAGVKELDLKDGRKIDWEPEFARKLISLQGSNGGWVNDTGRWMEKDPILVTSYCVMALEIVIDRL
ncbi:MAG TPA: prenyltransferase/squalene oxidase repeat-containing protein [Chthoniobacter sp.]|jgi:squalene-hopene/tetraprenyl-beta-curcumene cyclase